MRKFTKCLLTLALLVLAVGGAKAQSKTHLEDLQAAKGTTSDWVNSLPKSYPVDATNQVIFGSDANEEVTNANVNNYDYIYFEVINWSKNKKMRVFFWDPLQNKRLDYYLKPIAEKETANYAADTDVTGNGTYCVKIPDGARLQGAKAGPWNASADADFQISEIYLTERATPYVEIVPYTLEFSAGKAIIPVSESHVRASGNVSINYATGEVTSTGTGSMTIYLNKEDLVGASLYHLDFTGDDIANTLTVTDDVNGMVGGGALYGSRYNWIIANDASRRDVIGAVTSLTYNINAAGTMTITSIYITADELFAGTAERDITALPYGIWGLPANKVSSYISADSYKTNNIDGAAHDDVLYGHDGNGDANKYVDLTNCSKIIFTGLSSNGVIRLFYNWSGTDADKPIEIINDFPKTSGTYVFDIDAFKKAKGLTFFHLNGIKSQWAAVTLSEVKVVEYTNVLTGAAGINRAKNYLANPYLTYIDATGVTKATEINVSNPNCLIAANDGMVTNIKNVIVSGTCANLELVDGNPFQAPADFTATNAKFTKSMTAGLGTMVIPFAAALPTGVKAYDLTGVSGTAITTSAAASIAANKPVLLEAAADDYEFTATGAAIAATVDASSNGLLNGTYAGTTAAKAAGNYVLQNASAPAFYSVKETAAAIPPFRAYLTSTTGAPSLSILLPENGDVTGINATLVNTEKLNSEIFNLQGQRVAQPAKGLYIVNGKKVIVK